MSILSDWILDQLSGQNLNQQDWFPVNPEQFVSDDFNYPEPVSLKAEDVDEWIEFLTPYNPSPAVLKNLQRLKQKGAAVVATGQQPGLIGGPFYSASKAISAVLWARKLEKKRGAPVVPVFWVASDDHDFAEVATSWIAGRQNTVIPVSVPQEKEFVGHPVSRHPITKEAAESILKTVRENLPRDDFSTQILDQLSRALTATGANFESQFITLLLEWLGPLGVVPIVPSLSFLRRKSLELFEQELESAPETSALLVESDECLTREIEVWARSTNRLANDETLPSPAIHRKGTELNFFWHRAEGRCRLEISGNHVTVISPVDSKPVERLPKSQLLEKIQSDYLNLSPNAALRPLVQDGGLPNLATIGGFGELGYHAQIRVLYPKFSINRPALIPRVQFRLIPARVQRFLEKTGFEANQIQASSRDELTRELMRRFDRSNLIQVTEDHLQKIESEIHALSLALEEAHDPYLKTILSKVRQQVESGQKKIDKRLMHTFSDREVSAETSWKSVWDCLLPIDLPQERVFVAISPLLSYNGPRAVEHLCASLEENTDISSLHNISLQDLSSEN